MPLEPLIMPSILERDWLPTGRHWNQSLHVLTFFVFDPFYPIRGYKSRSLRWWRACWDPKIDSVFGIESNQMINNILRCWDLSWKPKLINPKISMTLIIWLFSFTNSTIMPNFYFSGCYTQKGFKPKWFLVPWSLKIWPLWAKDINSSRMNCCALSLTSVG